MHLHHLLQAAVSEQSLEVYVWHATCYFVSWRNYFSNWAHTILAGGKCLVFLFFCSRNARRKYPRSKFVHKHDCNIHAGIHRVRQNMLECTFQLCGLAKSECFKNSRCYRNRSSGSFIECVTFDPGHCYYFSNNFSNNLQWTHLLCYDSD